ncbi:MarR family winged helix-turn-helix transcriptional regulator [Frondihabitans cladoniiphilus]
MTDDPDRARLRALAVEDIQRLITEGRRITQYFSARQGLSQTDLDALLHVLHEENAGSPTSAGRIAERLGLTSGAATGVIDRLERQGHVVRKRDEQDRRMVRVHYGDQGMAVARQFFTPLARMSDAVFDDLDEDELVVVERFLARMSDAMGAYATELAETDDGSGVAPGE